MDSEKDRFIELLRNSLDDKSFVKITFGKYRGDDKEFQNIFVTRIIVKGEEKISFKFRYRTKDIVKNFDTEAGIKLAQEVLGKDFLSATLFTSGNDFTLDYSKKRIPKLHTKKSTYKTADPAQHNRTKSRFIDPEAAYFYRLGITDKEGKVKADRYDKFRQVDKFIEIVDSLYRSSDLKDKDELKITDMGSGKSYMTFALYDYFTNELKKKVSIRGVEQRDELVKLSNNIAGECDFSGLRFESKAIEQFKDERSDIAVALHACDTATDDAIIYAVKSGAEIIILAPCCQKYLRKKIVFPELLKEVYRDGILEERFAVTLTDSLRAMYLEHSGYDTKIFEFISTEHTARNTMITAVKSRDKDSDFIMEKINRIKKEFGIEDFYLDAGINQRN
ncbi:MAG TPA: SAM-dependent methyltransferase [Ignavibacteria bacterium]|nr:SAM-dependent methyltransferase [Ignavibacteria bacterium]HMR39533.1 SAM-dependent methyltransferase [Ignavibacteria bacterium]